MVLSFHGAARTVTGTKHRITFQDEMQVLLDCGLFQGMGKKTDELNREWGFEATQIAAVLLSHAHIDHSGLLPKLVKDGFSGRIYCTKATRELTEILLLDSADIQITESTQSSKSSSNGESPVQPLYDLNHVQQTFALFTEVEYETPFQLSPTVEVMFFNTGHLIGSAGIHITEKVAGKSTTLMFSGDVGRYRSPLLQPPACFPAADYIILESTYGGKMHEPIFSAVDPLLDWIKKACLQKKGKLIIPAFSVGRTQEVLYALNQLELEKRLPELPYFVDSPLSKRATEVIKDHKEHFNDRLQAVLEKDDDPFHFNGLKYVETAEDSRLLCDYDEPCVIISASGTADAGRVKHHIFSTISDSRHTVLFVGYCQDTSLGGQLLKGAKTIELFGEPCEIAAEVDALQSLSAHGDADDLVNFISCQPAETVKRIFLVHGEFSVQETFAAKLQRKGYERVTIPDMHEAFELE